jgi:hypothetical protein
MSAARAVLFRLAASDRLERAVRAVPGLVQRAGGVVEGDVATVTLAHGG